ncbi:hypothetical protein [Klebsiella michiganensis]|uniref:hypothetical protein n=1 Tax=Klebsiella michiganensis TaxID=1134687 RepID=UPI002949E668|nr:hypothetical protein [Klebsiella michiganensis]MDV5296331.1 hypothetical protein [Klebsiella michiganensis]
MKLWINTITLQPITQVKTSSGCPLSNVLTGMRFVCLPDNDIRQVDAIPSEELRTGAEY